MALANMGFKKTKVGLIWEERKMGREEEGEKKRRRKRRDQVQKGMETELKYGFMEF